MNKDNLNYLVFSLNLKKRKEKQMMFFFCCTNEKRLFFERFVIYGIFFIQNYCGLIAMRE